VKVGTESEVSIGRRVDRRVSPYLTMHMCLSYAARSLVRSSIAGSSVCRAARLCGYRRASEPTDRKFNILAWEKYELRDAGPIERPRSELSRGPLPSLEAPSRGPVPIAELAESRAEVAAR
jgi:hypothetical protein